MLPFTSLNAVTSNGPGASRDLEDVSRHHTLTVTITGTSVSGTVALQGSHDGSGWTNLATVSITDGLTLMATADTHFVRYVRANLTSLAGTSPVVTATIASGNGD